MRALAALLLVGCGSVAPFPRVGDTEPHAAPAVHGGTGTLSVVLFTSKTRDAEEGVASLVQRLAETEKDSACPEHFVSPCTIVPSCETKSTPSTRPALGGSIAVRDGLGRTRVELRGEESKHGLAPWAPGEHFSVTGMDGFKLDVGFPSTRVIGPANQPLDVASGSALDVSWETSDPGAVDVVLIGHRVRSTDTNAVATCHFDAPALRGHVPIEVLSELRGADGATGWFQITHSQRASQTRGEQSLVVDAIEIARDGVLRLR